jgi:hypothetical protein
MTKSPYTEKIKTIAAKMGYGATSARGIEAYMTMVWRTLDALSPRQFRSSVVEAAKDVNRDPVLAEKLADSYGL